MADVTFGEPVTENNGCIFGRDFVAGFHFKSTKHPAKTAHYVSHAINSHDELVNQCNELFKALEIEKMAQDGWQLVPVVATKAMWAAWDSAPCNNEDDAVNLEAAYRAMLAAVPKFEGGVE